MIRAARLLGTENLLVVPGAVYVPWLEDVEPVPQRRLRSAGQGGRPAAAARGREGRRVPEHREHLRQRLPAQPAGDDRVRRQLPVGPHVQVHFDTGNIMQYHFPEHWIPLLGKRIQNVHLKEYTKKVHEFNLHTFRPLLDGTTNWPAVHRGVGQGRLPRLPDVRVLQPLRPLPRGARSTRPPTPWTGCWAASDLGGVLDRGPLMRRDAWELTLADLIRHDRDGGGVGLRLHAPRASPRREETDAIESRTDAELDPAAAGLAAGAKDQADLGACRGGGRDRQSLPDCRPCDGEGQRGLLALRRRGGRALVPEVGEDRSQVRPRGSRKASSFPSTRRPHVYQVFKPKGDVRNWAAQVSGPEIEGFSIRPNYDMEHPLYFAGRRLRGQGLRARPVSGQAETTSGWSNSRCSKARTSSCRRTTKLRDPAPPAQSVS